MWNDWGERRGVRREDRRGVRPGVRSDDGAKPEWNQVAWCLLTVAVCGMTCADAAHDETLAALAGVSLAVAAETAASGDVAATPATQPNPELWKLLLRRPLPPLTQPDSAPGLLASDIDTISIEGLWGPPQVDWGDSTFREYRITSAQQGEWLRESIPCDGAGGYWCDFLVASLERWDTEWIAIVSAYCEPSYPHADEQTRYLALNTEGVQAMSDWTGGSMEWHPTENGDSASGWWEQFCVDFELPMKTIRDGAQIRFAQVVPTDADPDSTFSVVAYLACHVSYDDEDTLIGIPLRPSHESAEPETVSVQRSATKVRSAMVRLDPTDEGYLRPTVLDIEVDLAGRRGWIQPGMLESLGFWDP